MKNKNIANGKKMLTAIFARSSILDVSLGSEYVSEIDNFQYFQNSFILLLIKLHSNFLKNREEL